MRPVPSMFGKRLRELRQWLRITPEQLASRAKLSNMNIRLLEIGYRKDPRLSTVIRIASALGVPLDYLLSPLSGGRGK